MSTEAAETETAVTSYPRWTVDLLRKIPHELKLDLYSRRGVQEYWIADWRTLSLELYRPTDDGLHLVRTVRAGETLTSPLLPGFAVQIDTFLKFELPR